MDEVIERRDEKGRYAQDVVSEEALRRCVDEFNRGLDLFQASLEAMRERWQKGTE